MSLRCRKNKINSQNTQVPIFTWVHSRVGEKKKVFSWYYGNFSWDCAAIRSFFFQGLQQPFPNFPPQRCFFSISQSNFWVFLYHLIILTFAVCRREVGGKLELVPELPKFKIQHLIFFDVYLMHSQCRFLKRISQSPLYIMLVFNKN